MPYHYFVSSPIMLLNVTMYKYAGCVRVPQIDCHGNWPIKQLHLVYRSTPRDPLVAISSKLPQLHADLLNDTIQEVSTSIAIVESHQLIY